MEEMAAAAAYEAQRRRRIEENKRRIEELGLRHLAAAAMPPKAKQQLKLKDKARAPGAAAPLRRSGRVANLPDQPDYRQNATLQNAKKNIGLTTAEGSYAIAKAKELESELGADYPTFVKTMGCSSTSSTTLFLPRQFCREHLPKHSEVIMLVDEDDDEFYVQYMPGRHSCRFNGFKGFAMKHKLEDGDCLVFRLIQQRKLKVYVIRVRLT